MKVVRTLVFAAAIGLCAASCSQGAGYDSHIRWGIDASDSADCGLAERELTAAIEIQPSRYPAFFWRARAREGCGNLRGALDDYLECVHRQELRDDDNSEHGVSPEFARLGAAHMNRRLGEYDSAIAHYNEVLATWPEDVEGNFGLGACLVRVGKCREAQPYLTRAESRMPVDLRWWVLAWEARSRLCGELEDGALALLSQSHVCCAACEEWQLRALADAAQAIHRGEIDVARTKLEPLLASEQAETFLAK